MRPYLTTYHCKKKQKPQVRCKMTVCRMTVFKMVVYRMTVCKMTVCKIIQFTRLQATKENARNGKRTNIMELSRPHKLPQGALIESF